MKRLVAVILTLCCLLALVNAGIAEDNNTPQVVKGTDNNAYLLCIADKCYLLGYADYDLIIASIPDVRVDYVVQYCEHAEHVASKQALAAQLNAVLITATELPPEMLDNGSILHDGYAFSADKKNRNYQTIDCVGNYLKYAASTNESSVNVREEPTTKAERVGKLKRGETLTVVGQTINSKGEVWYQVELENGKQGYIRSDLLEVADEVPETKESVKQESKKEDRYVGNKKSKVFHRPTCNHLPSSKNIVYFSSRSYAVSKGYKPCSHCNP